MEVDALIQIDYDREIFGIDIFREPIYAFLHGSRGVQVLRHDLLQLHWRQMLRVANDPRCDKVEVLRLRRRKANGLADALCHPIAKKCALPQFLGPLERIRSESLHLLRQI